MAPIVQQRGPVRHHGLLDLAELLQAPMLAALVASEGGAVDFIYDAVREGRKRWRRKHEIIAADEVSSLDMEG